MTAQQVVRWCRAIARCAAALADELEQTTTEADRAEVGDPDPTGPVSEYCGSGNWPATPGEGLAYACSRQARHGGAQHVATDGETVLAVWPT